MRKRKEDTPRVKRVGRVTKIVFVTLLVLALLCAASVMGVFAYYRWYMYDDAADIQGTWYIYNTDTPIEITATTIKLTDKVSYNYTLDPTIKTLTLDFGNLRGSAHYRFALEREELVIFDGNYTFEKSLMSDVNWLKNALIDKLYERKNNITNGAIYNLTHLLRIPASQMPPDEKTNQQTSDTPRVVWSAEGGMQTGTEASASQSASASSSSTSGDSAASSDSSSSSASSSSTDSLSSVIDGLPLNDTPLEEKPS